MTSFQCEPGFSLVGGGTVTCNNSGLWSPDPALLMCTSMLPLLLCTCILQTSTIFIVGQSVPKDILFTVGLSVPETVDIAPIAGGVVGGLIAVILVVLMVIVLVVFLVQRVKGETTMMCVQCAVMSALVV